jgi:hypothetical protein
MGDPLVLASSSRLTDVAGDLIAFSEAKLLNEVLTDIDIAAVRQISDFSAPHKARAVFEYIEYS